MKPHSTPMHLNHAPIDGRSTVCGPGRAAASPPPPASSLGRLRSPPLWKSARSRVSTRSSLRRVPSRRARRREEECPPSSGKVQGRFREGSGRKSARRRAVGVLLLALLVAAHLLLGVLPVHHRHQATAIGRCASGSTCLIRKVREWLADESDKRHSCRATLAAARKGEGGVEKGRAAGLDLQ